MKTSLLLVLSVVAVGAALVFPGQATQAARPNVILIMTDDQGYGDLGFHGNPVIQTPRLDRFAEQSVILENFYVCPVCAPTRASLMTGRYNYRTRAIDTYLGRAMMDSEEVTLAEYLHEAGYKTGIFGKWHLGDNYPMRPIDQGFDEALVHGGGGMTQPGDYPGNTYFDPVLSHNGEYDRYSGYCTDIFTDAAIDFIQENSRQPFFAYIPYNACHTPLQVPEEEAQVYRDKNLSATDFPQVGHPLDGPFDAETTARVYGMVSNIDDNVGLLLDYLDRLGIADKTLVVFLTDNGPQQSRYNGGLHGKKGSVYDGGIRVPCFIRWPAEFPAGKRVPTPLAHIDMVPTLLDICGVEPANPPALDGRDFLPLIQEENPEWPERNLFFQWHRGDVPEKGRAFSARGDRYKLVQAQKVEENEGGFDPRYQLYDLREDPYEMQDLAASKPEVAESLKQAYEAWFDDVSSTRGYDPPRIVLGASEERTSVLTRQDWRGPQASWGPKGRGYWEVYVPEAATFRGTVLFQPSMEPTTVHIRFGPKEWEKTTLPGQEEIVLEGIDLPAGEGRIEATVDTPEGEVGAKYLTLSRVL